MTTEWIYKAINPECEVGKHENCDNKAMCEHAQCDNIHACQCDCHDELDRIALAQAIEGLISS